MANTPANSRIRDSIQPRRWLKFLPVKLSSPHKKARRTQRETTWYHGVSDKETRADRGMVMAYLSLEVEGLVHDGVSFYVLIL